ncbi:MFS transporter asaE [Vanrija pseudolonga]|uniref:MFS transporter asaE n=1 Tax=Vanrija pseudolonga TaxID=143232 RepID=A0AAF0Y056_9TREE|nr:MFS transporter asaE [Vanrija pseudolonga]
MSKLSTATLTAPSPRPGASIPSTPGPSRPESIEMGPISGPSTPADEDAAAAAAAAAASLRESNIRSVIICVSSFLLVFTTCGTVFSFGIYQELYQTMSREPGNPFSGASPAAIDVIGTLSVAFMTIAAPLATAWTKRFSPRIVISLGTAFFFLSAMLASFSTRLWEFILTQGLMAGLGTCFAYMPAVTVAPTWYGPRRGLALGIIMSGTGVGGLVWAPALQALNAAVGFRNGLRISGGISTFLLLIGGIFIDWDPVSKARLEAENARLKTAAGKSWKYSLVSLWNVPLVDWRIARSSKFSAQLFASFLQSAAYYTPVFFFSAYAKTLGYSAKQGANFIAINNACNAIGKIAFGMIADKFGRINMLLFTTVISAIASFGFWMPSTLVPSLASGQGLFITYTITYGIFASAYVSLFPTSLVELFGPQNFASVNGILYMARGLATLVGTPTAGALLRGSEHLTDPSGYLHMAIMVGALLAGASVGVVWVRMEWKRGP